MSWLFPDSDLGWFRRFLCRFGMKPYVFCCPGGEHQWRATRGEEYLHLKHHYYCRRCPKWSDDLEGSHP